MKATNATGNDLPCRRTIIALPRTRARNPDYRHLFAHFPSVSPKNSSPNIRSRAASAFPYRISLHCLHHLRHHRHLLRFSIMRRRHCLPTWAKFLEFPCYSPPTTMRKTKMTMTKIASLILEIRNLVESRRRHQVRSAHSGLKLSKIKTIISQTKSSFP